MQRTDLPLRQVIHPAPKIEKIAERFAVQPKRQRINREIAPMQIQLNRTAFDSRERRGVIVKLCSRGNQVERIGESFVRSRRKGRRARLQRTNLPLRRAKLRIRPDDTAVSAG